MKTIKQKFIINYEYDVIFCDHLFHKSNTVFSDLLVHNINYKPDILIYIDKGVYNNHPYLIKEIKNYFDQIKNKVNLVCDPIVIVGGEAVKNDKDLLFEQLSLIDKYSIDRHCYIIGIGGGALLDFVGFLAAIAHRGIKHIRIPTTVLSQNDSGVGVKNGINLFGKKNFIGTFNPPDVVINDFNFLYTLDDRDWRSGIVEAIKVALIKDSNFFDFLESKADYFNSHDEYAMKEMIYRCAELHLGHIAKGGDPFEFGSARPLDFGHWAAHKLEQLTSYRLRHGEAVAIGIAIDVIYSSIKGMLSKTEEKRILKFLSYLGFDLYVPELTMSDKEGNWRVLEGLQEFREHLGGQLTVMLLNSIGEGVNVNEMDETIIKDAILTLKNNYFEN